MAEGRAQARVAEGGALFRDDIDERAGCAWALDREDSGGGAAINLAVHFVDLACALTGSRPSRVHGQTGSMLHGLPVEDHAVIVMKLERGADVVIETGYGYPDAADEREFRFSAIGRRGYVQSVPGGAPITARDGRALHEVAAGFDSDAYDADYVIRTVDALRTGGAPVAGLADMQAALHVIDALHAAS